jgi:hypothetical protein
MILEQEFDEEDLAAGLSSRTPAFAMGMGMSGALGTPAMAAGAAMAAPMPASAEHADRRRRSSREDADVVERESSGRGMAGGVFGRLFGRFGSTSSAPAVSADAAPAMMPTSMPPPRPRKMRREEDGPRRVFVRDDVPPRCPVMTCVLVRGACVSVRCSCRLCRSLAARVLTSTLPAVHR